MSQENETLIRYNAMPPLEYPFQIDQPVLNGETFFLMVRHYYDTGRRCGLFADDVFPDGAEPPKGLAATLEQLEPHRRKHTHRLVRNLFDCLVLYYIDRFDEQDLKRATELLVRYAMALRVQQKQVRRDTVNNYALGSPPPRSGLEATNYFQELRLAMQAKEFLRRPMPEADPNGYSELHHLFGTRPGSDL